jgi:hypothetical protein
MRYGFGFRSLGFVVLNLGMEFESVHGYFLPFKLHTEMKIKHGSFRLVGSTKTGFPNNCRPLNKLGMKESFTNCWMKAKGYQINILALLGSVGRIQMGTHSDIFSSRD